jgi:hypothetical protein
MKKIYTILTLLSLLNMTVYSQLLNDNCADAIAIGEVIDYEFSNINATTDGPYHIDSPCPSDSEEGQDSIYNDIWYLYTATFTGEAEWSLCSTADFDTKIAAYNSGATCPLLDEDLLDCNEDGTNCTLSTSSLIFSVTMGETYILRLGGYGMVSPGEEGSGTFTISQFSNGIVNDNCANATEVSLGIGQQFNTTGALTDGPDHPNNAACFGFGSVTANSDIWYTYTPDFTGSVVWSTCNSITFDSRLVVYGPDLMSCDVTPADLYACNDDGSNCSNYSSRLFFDVEEGKTYLLRLGGFNTDDSGPGTFDLENENPPTPPDNDLCADAIDLQLGTVGNENVVTGTTINSLFDSNNFPFPSCLGNTDGGEFGDVFYSFSSDGYNEILVNLLNTTVGASYFVDIMTDCSTTADTLFIESSCYTLTSTDDGDLLFDTLRFFPSQPTDYILRISTRLTSDTPGDFFLSLTGIDPLSTNEHSIFGDTSFSPNPLRAESGVLHTHLIEGSDIKLNITNLTGKLIHSQNITNLSAGEHAINVDLEGINPGVYIINMNTGDSMKSIKVFKL